MEPPLSTLIRSADGGDGQASEALFAALYRELRGLARRELARVGPGAALGVTSLLHEAYLDIAGREGVAFPDRARFFTYAARVMRGLIFDGLRRRQGQEARRRLRAHLVAAAAPPLVRNLPCGLGKVPRSERNASRSEKILPLSGGYVPRLSGSLSAASGRLRGPKRCRRGPKMFFRGPRGTLPATLLQGFGPKSDRSAAVGGCCGPKIFLSGPILVRCAPRGAVSWRRGSLRGSSGTLIGPEIFFHGPIPFYFGLEIFRFERFAPIGGPMLGLPTHG